MELKGDTSKFEIEILGRSNPNSTDEWDRKWIEVELKINLNGFNSLQYIELLDDDLIRFNISIGNALKDYSIPIIFDTLEEFLHIEGRINQENNTIFWKGYSINPNDIRNKLDFNFETDIGQIEKLQEELKMSLDAIS